MKTISLSIVLFFSWSCHAQVQIEGTVQLHADAKVGFFGDITNNGAFEGDSGEVVFSGSQLQLINGSAPMSIGKLYLEKSNGALSLETEVKVYDSAIFANGVVQTDLADSQTVFLHLTDNAVVTGASDASFVNGMVRKTGDEAFIFPTGNNGRYRPISISAPSLATDHFSAYYLEASPNALYPRDSLDSILHHVSDCEYWGVYRTNGSSDVSVTLSWDDNSCGVDALCDLAVARWGTNQWESLGNGGTTGTNGSGTLVTGANCSIPSVSNRFGEFTLGSKTSQNPLPVELIDFVATLNDKSVVLAWNTNTEFDSDYFRLHRSDDLEEWEFVANVNAAGYSNVPLSYEYEDIAQTRGLRYYLLEAVDMDGTISASKIEKVNREHTTDYLVYPNPSKGVLFISGDMKSQKVELFDAMGRNCTEMIVFQHKGVTSVQLDLDSLVNGIYTLRIGGFVEKIEKR
ncbi:MAG: T9SS type A sorting domain-containing protein [Fluviicola sp.]